MNDKDETKTEATTGGVRLEREVRPGHERRLKAAYARLMKCLNDDDQEDCLYEPTMKARDAVNKILGEMAQRMKLTGPGTD
jgi:hypothetical protein